MVKIPFFWNNGNPPRNRRDGKLQTVGEGDPIFIQKFKGLRAIVEQKVDIQHLKVLGITSSIAGEGKTLCCALLGRELAATGRKKVLLVDVDIRKGDLTRGLGLRRSPGMMEYLLGSATLQQVLKATDVPNLFLIACGSEASSPADLLAGEKFKSFIKDMRDKYDTILIDTPPILAVADTLTIREMADGFIVLCRAGFTPRGMLEQALEELGEKHVLGAVLNCVEAHSDHYYQKYYGSYYQKSKPPLALVSEAKSKAAGKP